MPIDPWGKGQKTADNAGADAATPGSRPKVRLKLKTADDLDAALQRLIRSSLAGVLDTVTLGRVSNSIAILHRIRTDNALSEITERLDALEGAATR